jgi:hypothetical protein
MFPSEDGWIITKKLGRANFASEQLEGYIIVDCSKGSPASSSIQVFGEHIYEYVRHLSIEEGLVHSNQQVRKVALDAAKV